jgi:transcriptional regulator with XRE-family HTH domain
LKKQGEAIVSGTFKNILSSFKKLQKLKVKQYRDAHVRERIRIGIPYQIRALREQDGRNWTQAELGKRVGKPQNVISRLEDPNYGKLSIQTLLEVAAAFDVALLIKFVSYSRLIGEFEDVSQKALEVQSFEEDMHLQELTQINREPDINGRQSIADLVSTERPYQKESAVVAANLTASQLPRSGARWKPLSEISRMAQP